MVRVGEFLDPSSFSVPASSDVVERVLVNVQYYSFNYAAVWAALLLVLSVQQPALLFACVAIGCAGYFTFRMRTDPVVVAGTRLSEQQVRYAYAAVSAALFLYAGGWPMLYVSAVAALLALVHAALRQRSVRSRGSVSAAQVKEKVAREVNDLKAHLRGASGSGSFSSGGSSSSSR